MPKTDKELTVEECLAELREMFPDSSIQIRADNFRDGAGLAYGEAGKPCTVLVISVRGGGLTSPAWSNAPTLHEAMAKVREWKSQQ